MKRTIQPLYVWAFVLLLTSCNSLIAPIPFVATSRHYVYVDPRDPNDLSRANSDPGTYKTISKIDLTLKPDVIP